MNTLENLMAKTMSAEDYKTMLDTAGDPHAFSVIPGNGIDDPADGFSILYPGGGRFGTCNTEQAAQDEALRMNLTLTVTPDSPGEVIWAALNADKPMLMDPSYGHTLEGQLASTQIAAHSVVAAFDVFANAKTPLAQANALVTLANAMSDLSSWVPPVLDAD